TLSVVDSLADLDGLGSITYTWKEGSNVLGSGSTLLLTQAHVGKAITVTAAYTDGFGAAESVTSAATSSVANINDAPTGSLHISGSATQGQTLSVVDSLADLDGLGSITYTWKEGSNVLGSGSSLVLTQSHVGKAITVTAAYTDGFGAAESVTSAATSSVANINDAPTGSLSISGSATQGQTLTVSNSLADLDGLGSITYTWKEGANVLGSGSSLVLTQAHVGKAITVTAAYTDGFGAAESVTSAATASVANINDVPTGSVNISGVTTEGETLTASHTLGDLDGLGAISYTWKDQLNNILGTGSSLLLTEAHIGKNISVTASYTDGFGASETRSSSASAAIADDGNTPPSGSVTFSASGVSQTFTQNNDLIVPDGGASVTSSLVISETGTLSDVNVRLNIIHSWVSDLNLYLIHPDGTRIELSSAQGGGDQNYTNTTFDQQALSSITTAAAPFTGTFRPQGNLSNLNGKAINGTWKLELTDTAPGDDGYLDSWSLIASYSGSTLYEGQTLSAANTLADVDGLGTITYTWKDGAGATLGSGSTLNLTSAHVGKTVAVTASYTDGLGRLESKTSSPSGVIYYLDGAPAITAKTLVVSEGSTTLVTSSMIEAVDTSTTSISFTVSAVTGGSFQLLGSSWANASTFTRAHIAAGKVRFVADGGSSAPTFNILASDGSRSSPVLAGSSLFTGINDAPVLLRNGFDVTKGIPAVLDANMLGASDEDDGAAELVYTVSDLAHGNFEKFSGSWSAATSFTQADVNAGHVRFIHDGSLDAPAYSVSVSDGEFSLAPVAGSINFSATDTPPTVTLGTLVIEERESQLVTSSLINASDDGAGAAGITFTVSNLSHAQFEKFAGTWGTVTSFTKQDVLDGKIRIVLDGSDDAPAYSISASDALASSAVVNANINFTATNDSPLLLSSKPLILNASTHRLDLSTALLNASDLDAGDSAAHLVYTWSDLDPSLSFQIDSLAVTSFTQADLAAGRVSLVRSTGADTGVTSDTLVLTVTDLAGATAKAQVAIYDDAMLNRGKWTDNSLSYCFLSSLPAYYLAGDAPVDNGGFTALTESQKNAVRSILAMISDFTNLTFNENTADSSGAASQLSFAACNPEPDASVFAYLPSGDLANSRHGDFWFDRNDTQALTPGNYSFTSFLRGIGLALGLSHPYDDGLTYVPDPADDPARGDWAGTDQASTVMSYNSHPSISFSTYAQSYLIQDIASLQQSYGSNSSTNSGDTSYSFAQFDGKILSFWDAGGTDLFDFSAATYGVKIDLRPGHANDLYDLSAGGGGNLFIPFGVNIENAKGGSFSDLITGNDGANVLSGMGGNDTLISAGGADTLNGGDGDDLLVSTAGFLAIDGGAGTDTFRLLGARLDFTEIAANALTGVEIIDLETELSAQVLRLKAADILEIAGGAGGSSALRILGGSNDQVDLDLESSGYLQGEAITVDSVNFDLWHSAQASTAEILVQQGIAVV
ncbi:MAG: hypothetical protein RL095_2906, partial [Verrucomicrobiota bacterium]